MRLPVARAFDTCRAGQNPKCRGDVAQLGEHLVRNEGVGGSSPLISTILLGQAQRNPNL